MTNKKPSLSGTLLKAGFLSLITGLFALLIGAIFGSPKMAIEGGTSQAMFWVLLGAFLAVLIYSLIWRLAKGVLGEFTTSGPYRYVRYPVFGAIIFLLIPGLAILFRSWFLLFACVFIYFIWKKAVKAGERQLREIFGEQYLKYQKTTRLFFPNLFAISRPLFLGFWTLAIFIFIFVGLNYSAFYLRAIEWREDEEQQPVAQGPIRGDQGNKRDQAGDQNLSSLPAPRQKYDKPDSIIINKIKIEAPLVFAAGTSQKELNSALDQGVIIYPGSKLPGQPGEVFLSGHSSVYPWNKTPYGQVFTMIDKLEAGDIMTIYYGQYKYDYRITNKSIVKPDEVRLSGQTGQNTLTLMTCWPIGTALKRLLVYGEEIK